MPKFIDSTMTWFKKKPPTQVDVTVSPYWTGVILATWTLRYMPNLYTACTGITSWQSLRNIYAAAGIHIGDGSPHAVSSAMVQIEAKAKQTEVAE